MFNVLSGILSALDPLLTSNVVGISTDGANANTGWSCGVASRIEETVSSQYYYQIWYRTHYFNLCDKAAGNGIAMPPGGGVPAFNFGPQVSSPVGIVRRQGSLTVAMEARCPRFLDAP
jgi:hypothetical protein